MKRKDLPKTLGDLKALDWSGFITLWQKYFDIPVKKNKAQMLRPLWYKLQCLHQKTKVLNKHINRLKSYGKEIETFDAKRKRVLYRIKPGTHIQKTFKGETFQVQVMGQNKFIYDDKIYTSLSAAAKEISGLKVSGPKFFGLISKSRVTY